MAKGKAFSEMLLSRPLIFTALPLRDSRTGDKVHDEMIVKNLNSKKEEIAKELKDISRLNAISVPELVEENHEGKPRYNSIYTRALASGSADLLHKDAIVNKVIAHMESYEKFVEWVSETYSQGIRNVIFVGGNTRHHRYPGPSVSEADVIARHIMEAKGMDNLIIGNICLPERRDEAKRMLFKTLAGAQFFTTQILFDNRQIIDILVEYNMLCLSAGVKPSSVMLSFAPLKSSSDLNLLDFLGVDMPVKARDYILESGGLSDAPKRSVINALRVYRDVAQMIEGKDIEVPTGINVEQLTRSNFFLSVWMLREFGKAIDSSSAEIGNQIQTAENR